MNQLIESPLGKTSAYINTYTPSLLFPIPRTVKRSEIGVGENLPFTGTDIWNGYELSWLNPKGKPVVAIAEFQIPCESPNIIESKSFKLYLNSFNNSRFDGLEQVRAVMEKDLSNAAGAAVMVKFFPVQEIQNLSFNRPQGMCLDDLDVDCSHYMPIPEVLKTEARMVEETFYSDLLKSNCLVTGQPDWGSIEIAYRGPKIDAPSLLQYIVSLRDHNEFHEQCVERIFCDILSRCNPTWLSVYARYTRRGGLDINPYRVTAGSEFRIRNDRWARQ